jgi:hypothetical protein
MKDFFCVCMYTYHHTVSLMVDLIFANVKLFYMLFFGTVWIESIEVTGVTRKVCSKPE